MSSAPRTVMASAPAKTNLALSVAAPAADGYHPLETLFLAVNVRETVTVSLTGEPRKGGSSRTRVTVAAAPGSDYERMVSSGHASLDDIPRDETNVAVRAAAAVCQAQGVRPQLTLHIDKTVPVAGGMAGGSADAAAALCAVDALLSQYYDVAPLGRVELAKLGARLGADVPFVLMGGLAEGRGAGQHLTPIPATGRLHMVFVPSRHGLSTPAVFRRWDQSHGQGAAAAPDAMSPDLVRAAASGDAAAVASLVRNDLQAAACELLPSLAGILQRGAALGALSGWVSGSGPTICFLAGSPDHARELVTGLRDHYPLAFCAVGPVRGAQVETG